MSAIYSFKTLPPPSPDAPAPVQRLLVFGDMGRKGGALSLDGMIEEVTSGAITAVIHGTCTAHGENTAPCSVLTCIPSFLLSCARSGRFCVRHEQRGRPGSLLGAAVQGLFLTTGSGARNSCE